MAGPAVELVLRYLPGARLPLAAPAPWYVLAEFAWSFEDGLAARLEQALEAAMREGLVQDGVVATSEAQRKAIWALRENPTDAMAHEGVVLRHDVAVPVSRVPDLIVRGAERLGRLVPGVRIMPFGHLGDGNVHYNLLQPEAMAADAFIALKQKVQRQIFDLVASSAVRSARSMASAASNGPSWRRASRRSSWRSCARSSRPSIPKGILNPGAIL